MNRRLRIGVRVLAGAAVLFVLGWFAYAHADQAVTLDFGLFRLRRVPLSFALYGSIILGMIIVLGVGFRSDLQTRQLLRRYRRELGSGDDGYAGTGVDEGESVLEKSERGS